MSKPSIIIVHGAYHQPAHFESLIKVLRDAGYRVFAPPLPSTFATPAVSDMDPDVEAVVKAVSAEVDEGQEVVVFAHSYGGMPASSALPGLDKKSRQEQGLKGGVIGVVYLAAMMPDEGLTLMDYRPQDKELVASGKIKIVDGIHRISPEEARFLMYNRQTDPAIIDRACSLLTFWAVGCGMAPMKYNPWRNGIPCTYIFCENDTTMPLELQTKLTEGRSIDVIRCDGDHSPFLDRPEWVAKVIKKVAGEKGLEL
ncbi:alpha/beta-hydrolase [Rhizodiscina lignyota]|uniref:Alpha/beta-hydrolase n=1 Tax=Rhizodiscina lignyota TaxID=1504668 RepID=A0A9P4IBN2_9PEZI|nr:alpha/beta-hydrolase [Rhizodiscina lignyota]